MTIKQPLWKHRYHRHRALKTHFKALQIVEIWIPKLTKIWNRKRYGFSLFQLCHLGGQGFRYENFPGEPGYATCGLSSSQSPRSPFPHTLTSNDSLLLLSACDPLRRARPRLFCKKSLSQCRIIKKKATRLGGFLYKQINLIISWRTEEHDVRISNRTSFFPSFLHLWSGNQLS